VDLSLSPRAVVRQKKQAFVSESFLAFLIYPCKNLLKAA